MIQFDDKDESQPMNRDKSTEATVSKLLCHMQQMRESVPINLKLKEELKRELIQKIQQMRSPKKIEKKAGRDSIQWYKRWGIMLPPILLVFIIVLYSMTNTDLQVLELKNELFSTHEAAISSRGDRIAALTSTAVEVMDTEGVIYSTINLPFEPRDQESQWESLTWSPTDQMIAIAQNNEETGRIWILAPNHSSIRLLVEEKGVTYGKMSWSPNQQQLIVTRKNEGQEELMKINLSDSNLSTWGIGSQPAWSRDGKLIALVKEGEIITISETGEVIHRVGEGSHPAWTGLSTLSYVTTDPLRLQTVDLSESHENVPKSRSIELPFQNNPTGLNFSLSADGKQLLWVNDADLSEIKVYKVEINR
jgi:TolB protein